MTTYPGTELKVTDDWRYSNPKMELREQSLTIYSNVLDLS